MEFEKLTEDKYPPCRVYQDESKKIQIHILLSAEIIGYRIFVRSPHEKWITFSEWVVYRDSLTGTPQQIMESDDLFEKSLLTEAQAKLKSFRPSVRTRVEFRSTLTEETPYIEVGTPEDGHQWLKGLNFRADWTLKSQLV